MLTHRNWFLIGLFLTWLFFTTASFYIVQKPISANNIETLNQIQTPAFQFSWAALTRTVLDMVAAVWITGIALGLGLAGLTWLLPEDRPFLERIILGIGIGFGMLGLIVFLFGLIGLLNQTAIYTLAIILTGVALVSIRNQISQRNLVSEFSMPSIPITLYLILTMTITLTIALLPPTDWDGLFYHLTGPKLYIAQGQIIGGIDIPHLNFPFLFEMLFMFAMMIRGDVTAKLLHFVFIPLLMGLVYLFSRQHLRLKNSWHAVLFLCSMPMIFTLGRWAYNDLALAFYAVSALYVMLINPDRFLKTCQGSVRRLILSGILCGLAMSLKYTSVVILVTLMGILFFGESKKFNFFQKLTFLISAMLVSLPWYLKSWWLTGNPVYPFVFGGTFWDEFRSLAYSGRGTGIGFDIIELITLPYHLTLGAYLAFDLHGENLMTITIRDANYLDGRSGILFLVFLPIVILYGLFRYRHPLPNSISYLLIFAITHYLFWMFGVIGTAGLWQSRLLLPAFVALCPVLAWLLHDLQHVHHPNFSLTRFLNLFIAIVLFIGMVDQLFNNQIQSQSGWFYYRPLSHLIGSETRVEYLTRRLGYHYATIEKMNDQLPHDSVVVFLWEPRSYYCRMTCQPDSILDKYAHLKHQHGTSASDIAQAWQEMGVTHVLVFRQGLEFLLHEEGLTDVIRPDIAVLEAWEKTYFDLVIDMDGVYQVYELVR